MRFHLDSVLDYRRKMLDAAQLEVSMLVWQHAEATRQLEELRGVQVQRLTALQQCHTASDVDAFEVRRRLEDLGRIAGQVSRQQGLIRELQMELDRKRHELVSCSQEKQMLERLRERHEARARRDLDRAETKTLDEAGVQHYNRRRGE